MSAQSSGQTPRSSISSQPSVSSSSSPVTRRSREPGSFNGQVIQHDGHADDGNAIRAHEDWLASQRRSLEMEDEAYEDRHLKRTRPRKAGGFLLKSSTPLQASKISGRSSPRSDVANGKRKVEDGDLIVPKRAVGRRQPKVVGGSPLASEITAGNDGSHTGSSRGESRHSTDSYGSEKVASAASRFSVTPERSNHRRSALGQDTNPADIVNLALNLSESRRRNFSGASMVMPREAAGGRRIASAVQPTLSIPYGTSGGSLRQHLREQRRISRNISPQSNRPVSRKDGRSSPQPSKRSSRQYSRPQAFETSLDEDFIFRASDATFARAEKARAALELGYEYRRLLQYLPTIPRGLSGANKAGERGHPHVAPSLGRAYNPLQYVRNRKVRFRDKKPLNPELDGWKDVVRVRAWVDAVKSERELGVSRVDDRFPLPPFDAVADQPTVVDSPESSNIAPSKSCPVAQSARPKNDWTFVASDLLADAYWIDQDRNVERIEDSSWQRIIRSPALHKGGPSKRREHSPKSPAIRTSASLLEDDTSPEQPREAISNGHHELHERGHRRKVHHQPKSSLDIENGSHARKSRWPKKFLRSRSSSSGSETDWSSRSHRKNGSNNRNNFDNAALEKNMLEMLAQEAKESKEVSKAMNGEAKKSDLPTISSNWDDELMQRKDHAQDPPRLNTYKGSTINHAPSIQQDFGTKKPHRRMSSEDLRTAPTSPIVPGLAPSIAVDISPSVSPLNNDPNPTLSPLKRPFASRLGTFRRDRSRSVGVGSVSENDTSQDLNSSIPVSRQVSNEAPIRHRLIKQRSTDPLNDSVPPHANESNSIRSRTHESKFARASRDANSSDSRFRGLFKGGRIAELVGSEVSKVGDILWRKDGNFTPSQLASSPASDQNSDASDQEDRVPFSVKGSPSDDLSRATTRSHDSSTRIATAVSERPKYYTENLPTFRSRFANTDQSSSLAAPVPNEDHIVRQQRLMKERGRSFNFDRLAPPKIDMRSVSPSPSDQSSRPQSRGPTLEGSRDSSGSRSTRGVRDADKRLNDMLGIPGRVGTGKVAPTGLAALSSNTRSQHTRGRPDIKRQWSISDRGISAVRGAITKRDIARVRALLLSSGVKATEISRRNEERPDQPSALLQSLQDVIGHPIPLIPPSQEFVFAARALIADIEGTNKRLRDEAEGFSEHIVEDLHNQIRSIDEQVNNTLTPLVRAAADDADAFSGELTTTHTLAVRQLNDNVDSILRRRRRRLRWIRMCGWALLEWMVLGVMWMVWFVVVIVRVFRGIVGGSIRGVRWLLFL